MLYIRMFLIMIVTLYTSRIILDVLGVVDYGIYDVVAGVIAMLSFFNSTLSVSTQRFLNVGMVTKGGYKLSELFSTAVLAHYIIAIVVFVVAETIGVQFVKEKLIIPNDRLNAALFIYHFSVFTFIVGIISTPYNAAILAYEKMSIFAYISLLEVILKLLVAFCLVYVTYDKLKLYGLSIFIVSVIVRFVYGMYCKMKIPECRFHFVWKPELLKRMFSFSSWMFLGTTANIFSTQGVNVLINLFFGPAYNAARAISVQVNNATKVFVENIMIAVRPQIIKSYTEGELGYTYKLVYASSKTSFFLLLILILPLIFEIEGVLRLWLKEVPEYTTIFARLILVDTLISGLFAPLGIFSQASGKIKSYQILISFTFLLIFILTYVFYKLGYSVSITFIISIIMSLVGLFVRLISLKMTLGFSIIEYVKVVILPTLCTLFLAIIPPLVLVYSQFTSIFGIVIIISIMSSIVAIWIVGLKNEEKVFIITQMRKFINKIV